MTQSQPTDAPDAACARHAERLLDEAIAASFPASDPVSAIEPGSVVNRVYSAQAPLRRRAPPVMAWVAGAAALGVVLGLALRAWRRRGDRRA